MYLQFRKAESVSSILLFLFNVFLTEMGLREITVRKILHLLGPFGKSETSIRMGLSRGVRNGLLVNFKKNGEVYYGITSSAEESFKYWWEIMRQFHDKVPLQYAKWDGRWTLVHIKESGIENFMQDLERKGFGSLDKSLFVSPYALEELINVGLNVEFISKNTYVFKGTLAQDHRDDFINDFWQVKELNIRYNKYIVDLNKAISEMCEDFSGGKSLPILHLFGLRLFNILQDDPQLPLELLPQDWMGIKAAQSFKEFRDKYFPEARSFIERAIHEGSVP